MMKRSLYITLLFVSLFGTGCIKEDNDKNSPCPSQFNLLYDWSHGKSLLANDSLRIVGPDGRITYLKTDNVGATLNLLPGIYKLMAYEPSQTVHVDGTTLRVDVDADGLVTEPAAMSAGVTTLTIEENDTRLHTLPMYYQTRELIIQMNFIGLGVNTLTEVLGTLEGVAASRDVVNGFAPLDGLPSHAALSSGKMAYVLDGQPPTSISKRFQGSRRLLGLDGASTQMLRLTFHFAGGYREGAFDITQALSTFHTSNVFEPYMVVINIVIREDFEADIIDWISGSQSEIEAL